VALHVDLHQTEFARSQYNAMVILPFLEDELPDEIQQTNRRAAEMIIGAWRAMGAQSIPACTVRSFRVQEATVRGKTGVRGVKNGYREVFSRFSFRKTPAQ
jgi:hypothetical protein